MDEAAVVRGDGPFGGNCVIAVIPLRRHPDYGRDGHGWGLWFFLDL